MAELRRMLLNIAESNAYKVAFGCCNSTHVWPQSTAENEFRLIFVEGEKLESLEKNPQSTGENQQTQLTFGAEFGN